MTSQPRPGTASPAPHRRSTEVRTAERADAMTALLADLTAVVSDLWVSPDASGDTDEIAYRRRALRSRLSLAHQRAEGYLCALGVPVPDRQWRAQAEAAR